MPAAAAFLPRPPLAAPVSPVDAPDQVVAAGGAVWVVVPAAVAADASATSREDGGCSVVASAAAVPAAAVAVTPAGRPLAEASVAYWIP
jgi:hypothetical protein